MTRFFDQLFVQRDRFGNGRALYVLAALAFLTPMTLGALRGLRMDNNVERWLPEEDREARVLAWHRGNFPQADQVLVTWDGSSLEDPRLKAFAAAATAGPDGRGSDLILSVLTAADAVDRMTDAHVPPDEAAERLRGTLVSNDGSPVASVVKLSEAGAAERPESIAELRAAAAAAGVPPEALRMGGSPVAATALNVAGRKASWNKDWPVWALPMRSPILTSCLLGTIVALVALRSFRLGVLVLAVSYGSTLMAVAAVPLAGDTLNMVLVVMPTLLSVLTLSGAIHIANYWKHAAAEDPENAVAVAVRQAWAPCALASVTTAVGLLSLASSTLTPVRQFGVYSALGCGIALVMVLIALPSLLQVWRGSGKAAVTHDASGWRAGGQWIGRHWVLAAGVCILAGGAATAGLRHFRTETKVIRYFPPSARIVEDYYAIEKELAGVSPVDVVVRFDAETLDDTTFLQRMERVRAVATSIADHPEVTGAVSLASFQKVTEEPNPSAKTFVKIRYRQHARRVEREVKAGRGSAFMTVAAGDSDLPGADGQPLSRTGDELWRIAAQASLMSDADYGPLIDEVGRRAETALAGLPGSGHVVTGTVPLFLRTQEAVLESLVRSFGLAFGLIAVVLMVLLRSVSAGLVAMIPNLLPVGLVFGLISWCGQRVDIGTMITASVALGVAVDGTLHLLTWFGRGLTDGMDRKEATAEALAHCGPAMWQTSAAVGLCLLALLPAELLLVSRFGWLMASLVGAALIADVVLLPALLAGPLGMILERKELRAAMRRSTPKAARPVPKSPVPKPHSRRGVTTGV